MNTTFLAMLMCNRLQLLLCFSAVLSIIVAPVASGVLSADCKLGQINVKPNLWSKSEQFDNWMDGRIRVGTRRRYLCFFVLYTGKYTRAQLSHFNPKQSVLKPKNLQRKSKVLRNCQQLRELKKFGAAEVAIFRQTVAYFRQRKLWVSKFQFCF